MEKNEINPGELTKVRQDNGPEIQIIFKKKVNKNKIIYQQKFLNYVLTGNILLWKPLLYLSQPIWLASIQSGSRNCMISLKMYFILET